ERVHRVTKEYTHALEQTDLDRHETNTDEQQVKGPAYRKFLPHVPYGMTERNEDAHGHQPERYDKKNNQRGRRHKVAAPYSIQVSVCSDHCSRQIERLYRLRKGQLIEKERSIISCRSEIKGEIRGIILKLFVALTR